MATLSSILQLIDLALGESAYDVYPDWGAVTDRNLAILEKTVGEITSKTVTTADVALTDDEELALVISCSGALTAARAVTVSGRKGFWFVKNACTGAFALTFKTDAGTGIVVPQGGSAICYSDGTNIVEMVRNPAEITQQTASGTSVDFTNIPSGVKRITVMFNAVSLGDVDTIIIQLGDSGGFETSGYNITQSTLTTGAGIATDSNYSGFAAAAPASPAASINGKVVLDRINSSHRWIATGICNDTAVPATFVTSGNKATSAEVDRLRVTAASAGTFDSGTINISYEF